MKNELTNILTSFDSWISKETKGLNIVAICLISIVFIFFGSIFMGMLLNAMSHPLSENPSVETYTTPQNNTTNPVTGVTTNTVDILSSPFFLLLLRFVVDEEIVFRLIPITLVLPFASFVIKRENSLLKYVFVILSSTIFGYVHGGYDHLLVQGINGVMLCVVYMKCGGLRNFYDYKVYSKGLICVSFVHFVSNYMFFLLGIFVFGARYFAI